MMLVQPAYRQPMADRAPGHARGSQLPPRDHPMPAPGESGDDASGVL